MLYIHRLMCSLACYAIFIGCVSSEASPENSLRVEAGDTAQTISEAGAPTKDGDNAETSPEGSAKRNDPKQDAGNPSLQLDGKLAIVTGGASGIGRSVSLVLAREGVTVIVADINETGSNITIEMLNEVKVLPHRAVNVDVRNSSQVKYLFECIVPEFANMSLSIVVNSAGILHRATPVFNLSESTFDNVINTNLRGTFLVTREAVKNMLAQNITDGAIVNIASILGKGGFPGISAYAASKGGVVSFTKSVALEVAKRGIRVNAILPGLTDTPMIEKYTTEQIQQRIRQVIPMGRMAKPIEISETIVFMCSTKASFMTGATVDVAGGMYL